MQYISVIAIIIQAAAIGVTAYFASRSLRAWRAQLVGKRRFEIAEDTLVAAYKARDAIVWIRNPAVWSNEKIDRPAEPGETEGQKQMRDTYFVHLKRIKDTADEFSQLGKMRQLCKVFFGDEAASAIDVFFEVRNDVALAANMLIDQVGEPIPKESREFFAELKMKIWGTGGPKDELRPKIDAALETLSRICREHLSEAR
jgi:hypothetical protein